MYLISLLENRCKDTAKQIYKKVTGAAEAPVTAVVDQKYTVLFHYDAAGVGAVGDNV